MRIRINIIFLLVVFPLFIFSQNKENLKEPQLDKGIQIIENARGAIGIKNLISKIESFQFKARVTLGDSAALIKETGEEISILLPDKILVTSFVETPFYSKSIRIWNGEKYQRLSETVFQGQRRIRDATENKLNDTEKYSLLSKERRDKLEKIKTLPENDPKKRLNDDMWTRIFPLILIHPFEPQAEFKYIGKAESANREANIIDTTSESGHSIRLFFDVKTNQLLMMIEKYKFFDGDYETKYYYSNRELAGNLLIPKKIKVEHRFTPTGKDTKVTHTFIDISEFKINAKFKSNFFDLN